MAKITRVDQKIFGSGAGVDQIAQFGSLFAGSPAFTTDPAIAMSLSNWLTGWAGAAIGGNAPAIEDMNAVLFVYAYQLAYLMQAGIAEWNTDTVYYEGSLVNVDGEIYVSRTDDNTGNLVTDADEWKKIAGDIMSALGDTMYGGVNGATTRLAGNTDAVLKVLTQLGDGLGSSAAPTWRTFKAPTNQTFSIAGTDTYTTPAGVMYIRVRMVGGGGGGGGSGTAGGGTGGTGGTSYFRVGASPNLLVASGGAGGQYAGTAAVGGNGGTASLGTGPKGLALTGTMGGNAAAQQDSFPPGGCGGASALGGGASGATNGAGAAGAANTGSGGGGGSSAAADPTAQFAGHGGGAGGFVDAIITAPGATYALNVGSAGAGGTAGAAGAVGGAGAVGVIEVTEYYQ